MNLTLIVLDIERDGNLIECGFWAIFGLALVIGAHWQPLPFKSLGRLAAAVSVAFGISDLVEAQTGAWWRPWWLLVWKALCVAGLVLCYLRYRYLRTERQDRLAAAAQDPSPSM